MATALDSDSAITRFSLRLSRSVGGKNEPSATPLKLWSGCVWQLDGQCSWTSVQDSADGGDQFHLLGTPVAVIAGLVYNFLPFMVLPVYVALERIDPKVVEAARDLYAGPATVFRRVILPLVRPGLVVLGVFTFMTQWTSYLWPLVIGTKEEMYTLTVGVQSLRSLFTVNWGVLSAGAVLSMLPLVLVFLFLQRYFIAGSIAGALKE